jgi:hypothetical protein
MGLPGLSHTDRMIEHGGAVVPVCLEMIPEATGTSLTPHIYLPARQTWYHPAEIHTDRAKSQCRCCHRGPCNIRSGPRNSAHVALSGEIHGSLLRHGGSKPRCRRVIKGWGGFVPANPCSRWDLTTTPYDNIKAERECARRRNRRTRGLDRFVESSDDGWIPERIVAAGPEGDNEEHQQYLAKWFGFAQGENS